MVGAIVASLFLILRLNSKLNDLEEFLTNRGDGHWTRMNKHENTIEEWKKLVLDTRCRLAMLSEFVGAEFVESKTKIDHEEAHYKKVEKKK